MQKIVFVLAIIMFAFGGIMAGCETSTNIECAYISEITSAGSQNYAIRITHASDSRLDDKGVDTQVKFSRRGQITIWQEGGEKYNYFVEDYDNLYSLTVIFATFENKEGQEKFEEKKDATNKTYILSSEQSVDVTFRVVAGDIEQNSQGTGQILVGSEPISKQYKLKIK
jgi:hypothetical protein